MDFSEIKAQVDILDVVSKYVSLKKDRNEYIALSPFTDEKTPSFKVNPSKQIFKCFSSGHGGDVIDFLLAMGKTHKEAVEELTQGLITDTTVEKKKVVKKVSKWYPILPTNKPSSFNHYKHGVPSAYWVYHNLDGEILTYTCRFDLEDGKKEVLPFSFCKNQDNGSTKWMWKGISENRPLYNQHIIEENINATVIVVEGEKCAVEGQRHFDTKKVVFTCWIGGVNGIERTDWSSLIDRRIIFFGDNDVQGISAMLHIKTLLSPKESKIIPLDRTKPKGWDLADTIWKDNQLSLFINNNVVDDVPPNDGNIWRFKQIDDNEEFEFGTNLDAKRWFFRKIIQTIEFDTTEPPKKPVDTTPSTPNAPVVEVTPDEPKPKRKFINDDWFRFLGYEKSESGVQYFYFYVFRSNQLIKLTPSAMTSNNLLLLAQLNFWENNFQSAGKAKFDIYAASNFLIENSIKKGIFNPFFMRGRGAWMDREDVVIHTGTKLIVNGQEKNFNDYNGKYTYEAAYDLELDITKAATNKESSELLELCKLLNWERDINAYFLAGFCAIAPMCGALKWRPHIWITGAAGTGKSWIFEKILRRSLGGTGVAVQSETTEAGIRQFLKRDALPVLFDEAEGEDRKAQERMQSVLTLMRGSSSSDGGMIIKGSAGGNATMYSIRSCFAYASIGVSLSQQSDRSRVTVLGVKKVNGDQGKDKWLNIQKKYLEIMSDEFIAKLQSRTMELLPVIIKNSETFASAAATVIGDQRSGDQIGTLLAGAWSLVSSKEVSFDDALAWIKQTDWTEETQKEDEKDEVRLINHLMERVVEVTVHKGQFEKSERASMTVGELVLSCIDEEVMYTADITPIEATKKLRTLGIRITNDSILISNTAEFIKKSLVDTAWRHNHLSILSRLPGATKKNQTTFGSGIKSKAIEVPLTSIF